MKRDLNLIRTILLEMENSPADQRGPIQGFEIEGKEKAEILEHVQLLIDAGMIEGEVVRMSGMQPFCCVVTRMTWDGHEFLAKAKNDTIWKKVMAHAEEKGVSTSMAIITGLLEVAAKKYVGLE